ncbi:hypothetical protein D3C87_1391000 [compost metagenome]
MAAVELARAYTQAAGAEMADLPEGLLLPAPELAAAEGADLEAPEEPVVAVGLVAKCHSCELLQIIL